MHANTPSDSSADPRKPRIDGIRIRQRRIELGLGTEALARRAKNSSTTLHHIEQDQTPTSRPGTLRKLAVALEVAVTDLVQQTALPQPTTEEQHAFDRQTNPTIGQVLTQRPRLFDDWSGEDWDELYSEFGIGGAMTSTGVISAAMRINRKRQTLRQLSVLLETDLGEVAAALVEQMFLLAHAHSGASMAHDELIPEQTLQESRSAE